MADVTREATLAAMVVEARRRWGRLDILHNNVGVSVAGGDKPPYDWAGGSALVDRLLDATLG
jgi:NAD(P)-dependent dehydrogenase (short-subunit alcohol dehydrogenase family)